MATVKPAVLAEQQKPTLTWRLFKAVDPVPSSRLDGDVVSSSSLLEVIATADQCPLTLPCHSNLDLSLFRNTFPRKSYLD